MGQILLANGLLKGTVNAIMMIYKNTKATVRSPDSDTDFCDIVVEVFKHHINTRPRLSTANVNR